MNKDEHMELRKRIKVSGGWCMQNQKVIELLDDLDRAEARAEEAEAANKAWDNTDCDSCPLRLWEACDEICANKRTLIKAIAQYRGWLKAEEDRSAELKKDRDEWEDTAKAAQEAYFETLARTKEAEQRIKAMERALKEWHACESCANAERPEPDDDYPIGCKRGGCCMNSDGTPASDVRWEFDYERFSEKGGAELNENGANASP